MDEIILDFTGVQTRWGLHEYLKERFSLPDYYGHNMDALWDCLYCSFVRPTAVTLRNLDALPVELGREAEKLRALFRVLEREDELVTVRFEENNFHSMQ